MNTINQAWIVNGTVSSGALTALEVPGENIAQAVVYVDFSTLATTQSFQFQSAQDSTGPWFVEASTVMPTGNVSTRFGMRIQGPIAPFVRPRLLTNATGNYNIMFVGVD